VENVHVMIRLSMQHFSMIEMIARTGSVSRAAGRLGLSQSALSHRIAEAERRLNARLFHRSRQRITLTSAGQRLLDAANTILREVQRAEGDIAKLSRGVESVLRLGVANDMSLHWTPVLFERLQRRRPDIEVEVIGHLDGHAVDALRNNTVDIAIDAGPVDDLAVESRKLRRDQLVAVLSKRHVKARKRALDPSDFATETYIAHHTTPEKSREYEQLFSRYDLLPKRVVRAGRTEALVELIRANHGLSIMPKLTIEPYLRLPGLVTRRIGAKGLFLDWHVATRKSDARDESLRFAIGLIAQVFAE